MGERIKGKKIVFNRRIRLGAGETNVAIPGDVYLVIEHGKNGASALGPEESRSEKFEVSEVLATRFVGSGCAAVTDASPGRPAVKKTKPVTGKG